MTYKITITKSRNENILLSNESYSSFIGKHFTCQFKARVTILQYFLHFYIFLSLGYKFYFKLCLISVIHVDYKLTEFETLKLNSVYKQNVIMNTMKSTVFFQSCNTCELTSTIGYKTLCFCCLCLYERKKHPFMKQNIKTRNQSLYRVRLVRH